MWKSWDLSPRNFPFSILCRRLDTYPLGVFNAFNVWKNLARSSSDSTYSACGIMNCYSQETSHVAKGDSATAELVNLVSLLLYHFLPEWTSAKSHRCSSRSALRLTCACKEVPSKPKTVCQPSEPTLSWRTSQPAKTTLDLPVQSEYSSNLNLLHYVGILSCALKIGLQLTIPYITYTFIDIHVHTEVQKHRDSRLLLGTTL